jgi:hypothetical protein
MHSTLTPKANDDPHDVVVVAPDAVRVAPSDDEELSSLLREAARFRSDAQTHTASDPTAGTTIPAVDTTFRPAALDVEGPSMARRLARGFVALLLAACIGGGALVWKAYGDMAVKQIAKLATQLVMLVTEKPDVAAQPAAPAVAADAAVTTPPAQTAAEATPAAAAPSADPASPSPRDLASLTQQVEQLKASIEQLKASQQQMSREFAKSSEMKASEIKAPEAKASEQNLRPKIPAPPPRRVAARTPRPLAPPYSPPPQALAAPAPPPAAAPYVPRAEAPYVPQAAPYVPRQPDYAVRPPESQTTGAALTDPELSSVPRPPMPLR